jgi:predicted Zn finger-like uncharacterized protein
MDVVCDRCKTEYEFDDALVSERGTTVKCTNCHNQFKIYRPTTDSAEGARSWTLRRPDGTVIPFDSLAVLQKWILEGRVSRNDEIARGNEPWKALGAIAELDTFFSSAESRQNSAAPKPPATATTPPGEPSSSPSRTSIDPVSGATARFPASTPPTAPEPVRESEESLQDPFRTAPAGTPLPVTRPTTAKPTPVAANDARDVPSDEPHSPSSPSIERAEDPPRKTNPAPSRPLDEDDPPAATPRPSARPFKELQDVRDDHTEDDYQPVRPLSGSRGVLIGVTLGVALAGGAVFGAWRAGLFGGNPTPPPATLGSPPTSARQLDEARALVRHFTRRSLEDAYEALTRALALAPDDPTILAARGEALAVWGELLRSRADDLEARARVAGADSAALRAEAALLRRESGERLERARADANAASRGLGRLADPSRSVAERGLADIARISGDVSAARVHLDTARRAPTLETDLVAALLERDAGAEAQAVEGLRAVVARSGGEVRARLALARLLAAQGKAREARDELDAVLRTHADHEDARALQDALARNEPPMAAHGASTATTATDAGQATPTPPAPQVSTATTRAEDAGGPRHPPDEEAGPRDYRRLVDEGDRYQTEGRNAQARERFRQALALRPNGTEALTGMGYVALDQRELSTAASYFRQALGTNRRYSEALIGLGETYASQGQYPQAVDIYNEYLQYFPSGPHANLARRQVEALQERLQGSAPGG